MSEDDADLLLPAVDACTRCGAPEAEHKGWLETGHEFWPNRRPRPDRTAQADITTQWTCTRCGAAQEVGGVCDGDWMDCDECGKASYVLA